MLEQLTISGGACSNEGHSATLRCSDSTSSPDLTLGRDSDERTRLNRMCLLRESARDHTHIPIECGCIRPLNHVAARGKIGFGARLWLRFVRDPF